MTVMTAPEQLNAHGNTDPAVLEQLIGRAHEVIVATANQFINEAGDFGPAAVYAALHRATGNFAQIESPAGAGPVDSGDTWWTIDDYAVKNAAAIRAREQADIAEDKRQADRYARFHMASPSEHQTAQAVCRADKAEERVRKALATAEDLRAEGAPNRLIELAEEEAGIFVPRAIRLRGIADKALGELEKDQSHNIYDDVVMLPINPAHMSRKKEVEGLRVRADSLASQMAEYPNGAVPESLVKIAAEAAQNAEDAEFKYRLDVAEAPHVMRARQIRLGRAVFRFGAIKPKRAKRLEREWDEYDTLAQEYMRFKVEGRTRTIKLPDYAPYLLGEAALGDPVQPLPAKQPKAKAPRATKPQS